MIRCSSSYYTSKETIAHNPEIYINKTKKAQQIFREQENAQGKYNADRATQKQ